MILQQFIKDCLTLKDGESYDVGRALWIAGVFAFIALSCYAVYRTGIFDPTTWGTGYGLVMGGGGAALKLKESTEP